MQVKLKHIYRVKKQLADGSIKEYWYHRLTGKRIHGAPGSQEFIASWHEAGAAKLVQGGSLSALVQKYKMSPEFAKLKPVTRTHYDAALCDINSRFGTMSLAAIEDANVRKLFMDWRDEIALVSLNKADQRMSVLGRVLNWAYNRGELSINHAARPGKLYCADRSKNIWKDRDIEAFLHANNEAMCNVFLFALYTGQRRKDILAMRWDAYDGKALRFTQSKTGRDVYIPCGPDLQMLLKRLPRTAVTILTNTEGRPWKNNSFGSAFDNAKRYAGIKALTFHDIRGTFVTRRSEDEWTTQQIATITGHSLNQAEAILEKYTARTEAIADAAMAKMRDGG